MTSYEDNATDIGDYLISSRSLAEYRAMFALSDADLTGRILDCPGGASSFTAELSDRGIEATAVDVVYAQPLDALVGHSLAENDRGTAWTTATAARYVWDFYGDPQEHQRLRRVAAERFAADIGAHPRRYVSGALPSLGFADDTFDLVVSSHFLFTYADRLDTDFHLRALTELARVSAGEVRVFPLVDLTGEPVTDMLTTVRASLHENGIQSALRHVDFEFQRGATEMLVLTSHGSSTQRFGAATNPNSASSASRS